MKCGECKYSQYDGQDLVCDNPNAQEYSDYVDFEYGCEDGEEKCNKY